jgi:hypothetical protein
MIPLSKRQLEVLRILRDNKDTEEGELVYERGIGYVGDSPVSAQTVFALLRLAALRPTDGSQIGCFERYTINSTGEKLLADNEMQIASKHQKRGDRRTKKRGKDRREVARVPGKFRTACDVAYAAIRKQEKKKP